MPVMTSDDFKTSIQNSGNAPEKSGVVLPTVYKTVGYKFPNAVMGESTAHVVFDGVPHKVKLIDKVYRFHDKTEQEIRRMTIKFVAAGFEEVLESVTGEVKKEEIVEKKTIYTLRHPEFQEMEGNMPFMIGKDEYSMNDGIIKTEKQKVKDSLLKKGFEIIKEEVL